MSNGTLDGKVAIVTGGGRGMGRVMALALLEVGARVTAMDMDADVLADVADEARKTGRKDSLLTVSGDVADEKSAAQAVTRTLDAFGRIDVLVNDAGIGQETIRRNFLKDPVKFWQVEPTAWRRIMDTNANGPYLMARAAAPHMIAQRWGRIINVTTSLDTMINGGFAPYGGSKAANEAHTAIMAQDLAGTGVTANVLVPGGPVNTRMVPAESWPDREALIQPPIMVPPLLWLASDASEGVTGRRFIAARWDPKLPPAEAAKKAGAPAAWAELGKQAIMPKE